ncbi:MAG: translation initiation factor IF-2 [Bacteroidetes bacterium]|nr:MAG: translation initiation factor IF-2 [Bacteroidota bacterium]
MTEGTKIMRLSKLAREFNIGITTIVDFLGKKGISVDPNPNTKISEEAYQILAKEFQKEKSLKDEVRKSSLSFSKRESVTLQDEDKDVAASKPEAKPKDEDEVEDKELFIKDIKSFMGEKEATKADEKEKLSGPKILGKIDAEKLSGKAPVKKEKEEEKPVEKEEKPAPESPEKVKAEVPAREADKEKAAVKGPKVLGKIELEEARKKEKKTAKKEKPEEEAEKTSTTEPSEKEEKQDIPQPEISSKEKEEEKKHKTEYKKLEGVTILGKIDLPADKEKTRKEPVASSSDPEKPKKRKRKRIRKEKTQEGQAAKAQDKDKKTQTDTTEDQKQAGKRPGKSQPAKGKKAVRRDFVKPEVSDEEISRQIRETLASLSGSGKSKAAKHRRLKRDLQHKQRMKEMEEAETDQKVLEVTEFISANELANLMDVQVTEVISTCMSLGLFVSINQRLDAETITIVADEFGYDVSFVSIDEQESIEEEQDTPEELKERAPIVTVMGHVDHGKTSLLDQIRHSNVIAGEAGGITQHIGAYSVQMDDGKMISFLDTPGHEAFTAMRARGARITDVAIIVVAADDNVMPQTIEAINHAQAAGVPIVIAINKIDKANANVDKVKEELAKINILVEDWGGKYQSQEISAKNGINIDKLLEKVLLEAELLDLKANPDRKASGTVIESSLDKGRGYLATILVQNGTLKMGDIVVAGNTHGRVKAMFNERNIRISEAGPATPVLLLGLGGAPQAGDTFHVVKDESEAKAITSKRQQLLREQGLRTQKHITLDEIGRRIAIGDFKELNIIIKGDVDGSVEALADSMLKLSTEEVQVNIIHKAVGSITEGDVLLASASNAVIIGFQVRPSLAARKLAENEQIDIRIYSVIYNAINEIKSAIEGMLSPEIEEKITANLEVREVFKITKVGTVAGCMVLDGKINRNSNVRVIRDGIVVYTGYLGSLKRFKDDVKEVSSGYECGLNVDKFNDIKVGDIIEAFETVEVARKLE